MFDGRSEHHDASRNFERSGIAKLEGCFTRWREYRWDVFRPYVERLPSDSDVLDVGCGSLVETDYLTRRGFRVTGIDLDAEKLERYRLRYDWTNLHAPVLRGIPLRQLASEPKRFALITAFDVIEHLPDLPDTLSCLRTLLAPGGVLLASVPNKMTATELQGAAVLQALRIAGRQPAPGVAHLQFKSPRQWREAFIVAGLEPLEWEMAIGPLVNTLTAVVSTPIQVALMGMQLLGAVDRGQRHDLMVRLQYWRSMTQVVERLHVLDEAVRPYAESVFAWNLVVLRRTE